MENQKKQQLENLKTLLKSMDLGINRLVIAEDGIKALSSVSYKDPLRLISVIISEMMGRKELADIILRAAKGFEKFTSHEKFEKFTSHQKTTGEISLPELKKVFEKLPKKNRGFSVMSDGDTLMVYAHGNPIELSADLCEAQEKDETLRFIMQSAVDVFRKDKELHNSIYGSFNPFESLMKHFNEEHKGKS